MEMKEEAPLVAPLEDRKLSVVKSWFTRSVSFGGVHHSATAAAAAAASKGLSDGHGQDQETWGGFNTTLKQLSMRRSKFLNENETVLGSPSMTPRNVTPLVPLTSLRWRSSPLEQESSEGEQSSRLGLSVTSATSDSTPAGDVAPPADEAKEESHDGFEGFYPNGQTTTEEEDDQCSTLETPENGHDIKSPPGEDVMTMTVDFLRARLLAERSASKAAKERIQELGQKVVELELKLEQVVEDKKKAEKAAEEALLKLLTGDFAQVADCTARSIGAFSRSEGVHHVTSGSGSGGEDIKEELRRAESSSVGEFSRTDSIASSLESKDSEESRRKISQGRRNDANGPGDLWVTPKNMFGTDADQSPKKQDKRAVIETRLRKMWSQISADMSALAVDGSEEAHAQEQLMSWMDQVPLVLQPARDVPQKTFNSATEGKKIGGKKQDSFYSQDSQYLSPPEGIVHARNKSEAEIMLEEYEAHKRVQREWERNYYESKQRLEQKSKESMDYRQRLTYSESLLEPPAERPAALRPRAHEPVESRETWTEQQLQQEYQESCFQHPGSQGVRRQIGYPPAHRERDSHHRPYAEDAFRNPPGNTGGAPPTWDNHSGGLGQTQLHSGYRQRVQRDSDPYRTYWESEKKYRHGHGRSYSADSSNWPTEEDTRVLDLVPHQQRLSGVEMNLPHPGSAQSNLDNHDHGQFYEEDLWLRHGKTGHRQDMYLDVKANGSRLPQTGPGKATEPPLYLGYGPAYDAPRDNAPPQPLQQERMSNKSVANVLLALQKAKASIQKSSSDLVPFTGFSVQTRASSEPVKFEHGLDPRAQYNHIPSVEHDLGATRIRPSDSSPSLNYNPSAMDLRPASNGHPSYVDQLNVGKGIDFFF